MAVPRRRRGGTPPPGPPKVTIVRKKEIYHWDNLSGHVWYTHFWVPILPHLPLLCSNTSLGGREEAGVGSECVPASVYISAPPPPPDPISSALCCSL